MRLQAITFILSRINLYFDVFGDRCQGGEAQIELCVLTTSVGGRDAYKSNYFLSWKGSEVTQISLEQQRLRYQAVFFALRCRHILIAR